MRVLDGENYTKVKSERYIIHLIEDILLRERKEPRNWRTEIQNKHFTETRRNQMFIRYEKNGLEYKSYLKRQSNKKQNIVGKPEIGIQCPSCKNSK